MINTYTAPFTLDARAPFRTQEQKKNRNKNLSAKLKNKMRKQNESKEENENEIRGTHRYRAALAILQLG